MMAWGSVGVSLPHSSRQQFSRGRPVAKSDLQSGDLVFFYSGISHVGLYADNGQVIHAPRPARSSSHRIDSANVRRNSPVRRVVDQDDPVEKRKPARHLTSHS